VTAIASWELQKKKSSKSTGCLHAAWQHCCGMASMMGKGKVKSASLVATLSVNLRQEENFKLLVIII